MVDPGEHIGERTKPVKPAKSQLNALEKLKRLDRSLHVTWSDSGIPSHLCRILSARKEEDSEKAARRFLSEHLKLFRIKENMEDLKLIRKTDSLGGCHVVFQQIFDDLPVYNAFTSVHMDKNNRVNKVDICYYPDLFVELSVEKGLSKEDAIRIAIDARHAEKRLARAVSAELLIYPKKGIYHVAWKVEIPPDQPYRGMVCIS